MLTNENLTRILALPATWRVVRVECCHEKCEAHAWLAAEPEDLVCPVCQASCPIHDHADERHWRHTKLWEYESYLHARVPRVRCDRHGVRVVAVPWAEPRQSLTRAMERTVLDTMQQTKTASGAATLLRLGWDQVHGVMRRAVARGLARRKGMELQYLAVDEKAMLKGHDYVTLIYDLTGSRVIDVVDGRTIDSLTGFWKSVKYEVREKIIAIAMDMWPAYITATMACVPDSQEKIVHDRFHVAQHMGKAVDDTRIDEHKRLKGEGDMTLTSTKHWWLYGQENLPGSLINSLAMLVATDLQTAKAWTLKENLRHLWAMPTVEAAVHYGLAWAKEAAASGLKAVVKVANLVTSHIEQIGNYAKHRITTGKAEGINSVVMAVKRAARGYRTWESFRVAILFFCGKLDLYPRAA